MDRIEPVRSDRTVPPVELKRLPRHEREQERQRREQERRRRRPQPEPPAEDGRPGIDVRV